MTMPYTKVIYKMSEISQNAERVKKYQERKAAVDILAGDYSEQNHQKVRSKRGTAG